MRAFVELFKVDNTTRIVDIGGSKFNWSLISEKPQITIVNIDRPDAIEENYVIRQANALDIDLSDQVFDICYSNSVIEHLSDPHDQLALANKIRQLAQDYYVQTPNKWFFIEPHFLTLFLHWLPKNLRVKLIPYFSVQRILNWRSKKHMKDFIESIELLDKTALRKLFPDAVIVEEKFLFMTKSLIAIRRSQYRKPPQAHV